MRIAQVVPLHVSVPPRAYGGTERVVHNLIEALVGQGHEVTLFASGDSRTSARLIPGCPQAINFNPEIDAVAYHVAMLKDVYALSHEFDVIHSHLDYLTFPFIHTTTTPTVTTIHWRVDTHEIRSAYTAFRHANFVAISNSQRQFLPHLNWVATIHHGVNVQEFPFYPEPERYLAFVGRIAPEKGPVEAIEIAKRAGIPLKIAAKVDPKDMSYFTEVVKPLLKHRLIEYLGPVDEKAKRELMGKAMALLLPINWPEPFGMVFIEALACGTPVLTRPLGAVPELLRDGVTGYIRSEVDDLVARVADIPRISRRGCRNYALKRFDTQRMASDYIKVYTRIQEQATLLLDSAPAPALGRLPVAPPLEAGSTGGMIERALRP
jgi:glycosyltransferase involved in cell wall biosynthesis